MANNVKPPAMVLQELAIKKGFPPPQYEIIHSISGSHNNRFDYRVRVAGVEAIGTGTSKQISKHDAAYHALKLLEEDGIYNPRVQPVKAFNTSMIQPQTDLQPAGSLHSSVNFIMPLKDICAENKIADPLFKELSDVGPPHCREFTYECNIGSVKTVATSTTKKMAKQLAAKDMLEKLTDMIQNLVIEAPRMEELQPLPSTEKNLQVLERYNRLYGSVIPDKRGKIKDFTGVFKELMKKCEKTKEEFVDDLLEQSEESLVRILDKLELQHDIIVLQTELPFIVALCINTDVSFTAMSVGRTIQEATTNTLAQTFLMLDNFLD